MSVLIAEGWKTYASKDEIPLSWSLHNSISSSSSFSDISGRRSFDLYGSKIARRIDGTRVFNANFIVDLTSGSLSSSTTLFCVGLNPANIDSSSYISVTNDRMIIEATGTLIRVIRRPFNPDGTLATGNVTVSSVNYSFSADTSYRIEIMVDTSSETSEVQVMINGVHVISTTFSRTIGAYSCDSDMGILSLYCQSSSNCRGRISNFIMYSDDSTTAWPAGALKISYVYAQANSGQTFSMPPLSSDTDVTISSNSGEEWSFSDISGIDPGDVKGVIGYCRLLSSDAIIPAYSNIEYSDSEGVISSSDYDIQPGTGHVSKDINLGVLHPDSINNMKIKVRMR